VELCKRPRLEARIDWLAFEGQHTEDAFMYRRRRLLSDKSFKSFNAKKQTRGVPESGFWLTPNGYAPIQIFWTIDIPVP